MKRPYAKLARYGWKVQRLLNLHDWDITIAVEDLVHDEAVAQIIPVEGRKHAQIAVADRFWEATPQQQRHYIVHELLHCYAFFIQGTVWNVRDQLAPLAWDLLSKQLSEQVELLVDGLAYVVERQVPLPDFAPTGRRNRGRTSSPQADSGQSGGSPPLLPSTPPAQG